MSTPEEQTGLDPAHDRAETGASPGMAEAPSGTSSALDGLLDRTRQRLGLFFPEMPVNVDDARRAITREFSWEPSPEALQIVVEIAETTRNSTPTDPQTPLLLEILATKILGQDMVKGLLESEKLDVSAIASAAGLLAALLPVARENEKRLRSAMESSESHGREFLQRVGEHFGLPGRAANAALAIAPTLQALAQPAAEGTDGTGFRSPTAEDAARSTRTAMEQPDSRSGSNRTLLNSIALRTMIREHLDAWAALIRVGGEDSSMMAVRQGLFVQLRRDKEAYDYFSDRLHLDLSGSPVASPIENAEELLKVQCDLVDTRQVLESVLAAGATDGLDEPDRKAEAGKAAHEAMLKSAVTQAQSQAESEVPQLARPDKGRERRRIKRLGLVAGVLFAIAIPVNILTWKNTRPANPIAPSDFSTPLGLQEVTDLGPVLYSTLDAKSSWSALSVTEKTDGLETLGRQAVARGFSMVIVVDAKGLELALWSAAGGTKLLETER